MIFVMMCWHIAAAFVIMAGLKHASCYWRFRHKLLLIYGLRIKCIKLSKLIDWVDFTVVIRGYYTNILVESKNTSTVCACMAFQIL